MTHLPKNPYCDACQRAKMVNVKSFRGDGIEGYDFTKLESISRLIPWYCMG